MTIAILEKTEYTVEEFFKLSDDSNIYELIEGKLVQITGQSVKHGRIIRRIFTCLMPFVDQNRLGEVLSGTRFKLSEKTVTLPDLAFISNERAALIVDPDTVFPGAPDIAIEVMSPSDKWSDVTTKVQCYLAAGARLVWVVDPFDRCVISYRNERRRLQILEDENLTGEDILPNFQVKVADLLGN
jgi:Uma2 family endonuclease